MPYIHRIVKAGAVTENKKMYSSRAQIKGIKRSPNKLATADAQKKINERKAEERLRWKLNANFGYRDLHIVLHYFDKSRTLEQCREDLKAFLNALRKKCAKSGEVLKYIAVTETKRMTNIHHHLIVSRMDAEIISSIWEGINGSGGISFRPMDRRGNHFKLAAYLMKESRSTMRRYAETGRRGKRFSCSQNLISPEPVYRIVHASTWTKTPKAKKGAALYMFDDGSTCRAGVHEKTGYPFQEYFEVYLEPPGAARKGRRVKHHGKIDARAVRGN